LKASTSKPRPGDPDQGPRAFKTAGGAALNVEKGTRHDLKNTDEKAGKHAFYPAQYARFESRLAIELRVEAYGQDFGQQGWRTIEEQNEIIALIGVQPLAHVLDIACGSGGPSLAIVSPIMLSEP
jgi:hypothetical protein